MEYKAIEAFTPDMLRYLLNNCLTMLTEEQRKELIENLQARIKTEPKE